MLVVFVDGVFIMSDYFSGNADRHATRVGLIGSKQGIADLAKKVNKFQVNFTCYRAIKNFWAG